MEHLDAQIGYSQVLLLPLTIRNVKKTLFSPLPKNKVEVFLRLSPTAEEPCITNVTDSTVKYNKDGTLIDFTFDKVFADTTSQEQIFRSVGLPLVDRFLTLLYLLTSSPGCSKPKVVLSCLRMAPQAVARVSRFKAQTQRKAYYPESWLPSSTRSLRIF